MLSVCEIYRTLQGEGSHAGLPCVLIRLAGCNLRCTWCDTLYAREGGTPMTREEVLSQVRRLSTHLAEVTGGEPLMQPESVPLMDELLAAGHEVLLETNGSLDISPIPAEVVRIVDVKCPESGESSRNLIANLDRLRSHDEVKFVLAGRTDFEWASRLVQTHGLGRRAKVIFTAASGRLEPRELASWLLAEGPEVRLGIQLHKVLWPEGEAR